MGFVSNMLAADVTASGYDARKKQTLAYGQAAKNRAYSQANGVDQAARSNALVEGSNMMTMRGNQRRAVGNARAQAAGSGFTSEGTGAATADAVNSLYEKRISDMAHESSTGSINAVNQAIGLRRQGDEAMRAAEAEAAQYRSMARGTRMGMWLSGAGSLVGAIDGGLNAYDDAVEWNERPDVQSGEVKPAGVWKDTTIGAMNGMGWGSSAANAFNPYMSSFTSQGWEKSFLKALGYGQR